jgi:hypothetical protein
MVSLLLLSSTLILQFRLHPLQSVQPALPHELLCQGGIFLIPPTRFYLQPAASPLARPLIQDIQHR